MKSRIGLIGLGDIAQKVYLPLLSANERVDIVGIASRSLSTVDRIGSQYRIEGRYGSLKELLACGLDAVFIHSPTETHYELVMEALNAGVDVYVDKPLSYRLEESEQMAQYALERGRLLAVGFNRRFAPHYVEAKRWLEETGGFDLAIVQKQRTRQQKHHAKLTLYDDLIHMLDLLLWLGGTAAIDAYRQRVDAEERLVSATGSLVFSAGDNRAKSDDEGVEAVTAVGDSAAQLVSSGAAAAAGGGIASSSAAAGQFSMVRYAGADLERLELHGGGRSAEVSNMEAANFYTPSQGVRSASFGSWDGILYRRGFAGCVEHFLDSLRTPDSCSIRADRVLETHRLVERLADRMLVL
ncbi:Gfo/Idh/MocA family protein [Paenibacillus thalictri]|uniref:Gfo/Idh/MocA family oxidoreductase n=1 Tax=Paenibacillus thalictri TaxID=2527873 RepID=A0A4Q9DHX6_9BACL|nr:Gfo/Idh/MocA family oxidoreductase [Paenibacillus thalictri]TBL70552.1 Gfo/Idh/MocA family oxidoreductase [Paenibacillus thalictri]